MKKVITLIPIILCLLFCSSGIYVLGTPVVSLREVLVSLLCFAYGLKYLCYACNVKLTLIRILINSNRVSVLVIYKFSFLANLFARVFIFYLFVPYLSLPGNLLYICTFVAMLISVILQMGENYLQVAKSKESLL